LSHTTILGIRLEDRAKNAAALQEILSKYGCSIKTRIGLHDVENGKCSNSGVIILEIIGTDDEKSEFEKALKSVGGVDIQKMVF